MNKKLAIGIISAFGVVLLIVAPILLLQLIVLGFLGFILYHFLPWIGSKKVPSIPDPAEYTSGPDRFRD